MSLYSALAASHPKISRGLVWCKTCGRLVRVNPAEALREGWPKCCGYTMTIDSPSERTPEVPSDGR